MKDIEPQGIFAHSEQASLEAKKAQRLAELQDLARYRARRIEQYVKWSDPVKRAAMIAGVEQQAAEARKEVSRKYEEFARMFDEDDHKPLLMKAEVKAALPEKHKWWQRCIDWVTR